MMYEHHLDWLGKTVRDKITKAEGVVVSICFDLYGCVTADVKPNKAENTEDAHKGVWLDVVRLIDLKKPRIMEIPNFGVSKEHRHGTDQPGGASVKSPR